MAAVRQVGRSFAQWHLGWFGRKPYKTRDNEALEHSVKAGLQVRFLFREILALQNRWRWPISPIFLPKGCFTFCLKYGKIESINRETILGTQHAGTCQGQKKTTKHVECKLCGPHPTTPFWATSKKLMYLHSYEGLQQFRPTWTWWYGGGGGSTRSSRARQNALCVLSTLKFVSLMGWRSMLQCQQWVSESAVLAPRPSRVKFAWNFLFLTPFLGVKFWW